MSRVKRICQSFVVESRRERVSASLSSYCLCHAPTWSVGARGAQRGRRATSDVVFGAEPYYQSPAASVLQWRSSNQQFATGQSTRLPRALWSCEAKTRLVPAISLYITLFQKNSGLITLTRTETAAYPRRDRSELRSESNEAMRTCHRLDCRRDSDGSARCTITNGRDTLVKQTQRRRILELVIPSLLSCTPWQSTGKVVDHL